MWSPRREAAWLGALVLLGFCLRWPQLSASFYGDETFSLFRDSEQLITPTEDRFRPLFFSLLYLWKQLGFHGETGLRALPLVFGMLQIPVAFRLGRLLAGARGALVFGALVTVNPLLIEFSQELRMYSMVPLIALLQALALATLNERASAGRNLLPAWIGFVAAGTVGVYTHFHYWFINAGFGLALLRRRDVLPFRQSVAAVAALGLLYLPDVPNLLRFQSEAASAPHLTATDLPGALPKLLAAFALGFNYFALPDMGIDRVIQGSTLVANATLALLVAIPLGLVGLRLVQLHLRRPLGPMLWMAHELFTVPALLSFAAVLAMKRNFVHPKYMVFCAPFLLLFVAAAFLSMTRRAERWLVGVSGAVVFGIAFAHFNDPRDYGRREDLRGVASLLRPALKPGSVVLWLGNHTAPGPMTKNSRPLSIWEYYGADLFPYIRLIGLPRPDAAPDDLAPTIEQLTAGKREIYYVWLEIARNTDDPRDVILSELRQRLGSPQRTQLNPRLVVYRWSAPGH